MEKFESYKPKSLLELSEAEIFELSLQSQNELIELVLSESKETLEKLSTEIDTMSEDFFSLDSFYEVRIIVEEYQTLMRELDIIDENFENHLRLLLEKIAKQNRDNVLIHTSDVTSLQNLLTRKTHISEVCATAGSLRKKEDIFHPQKKSIHAGLIFDPQQASAWFSKDVGSRTSQGKRLLDPQCEQFRCETLDDALAKKSGERIEAWVNTQIARPIALLLIDPTKIHEVIQLAKKNNFPVVFHSHLYE